MLAGAGAFVAAYPRLEALMTTGEITDQPLPKVTATSPRPWVAALALDVATAGMT